jgi:hypothetical protein
MSLASKPGVAAYRLFAGFDVKIAGKAQPSFAGAA